MFSLLGKKAVVTGLGKGLGRAMTLGLAEAGADIIGVDIGNMEETEKAVRAYGREFKAIYADLSNHDNLEQVAQEAIEAFGRVDILVNNAGVIHIDPAEVYPDSAYDFVMGINVKALFKISREIGKHMVSNENGKIINVASIQGLVGSVDVSTYVASKHAVVGFTKALANEWGSKGVNVNAIAPGFMITDNTQTLRDNIEESEKITERIPKRRWGNPEDLQGPVVFLASEASNYVNGHVLVIDGGYINN